MQGVTTALVVFIFVCVAWPHIVKHKAQFYWAVAAVVIVILLDAMAYMAGGAAAKEVNPFGVFVYVMAALLQVMAMVLLILSAGGLSARELAGEMYSAYETMRRGGEVPETKDSVTVAPISAQQRAKDAADLSGEEGRVVYQADPDAIRAAKEQVKEQQAVAEPPKAPPDSSLPLA